MVVLSIFYRTLSETLFLFILDLLFRRLYVGFQTFSANQRWAEATSVGFPTFLANQRSTNRTCNLPAFHVSLIGQTKGTQHKAHAGQQFVNQTSVILIGLAVGSPYVNSSSIKLQLFWLVWQWETQHKARMSTVHKSNFYLVRRASAAISLTSNKLYEGPSNLI